MDINTCIKYLDFVSQECDRHQKDGQISDDSLSQLIIEFQRFQVKVEKSELPENIKKQVSEIELKYTLGGVARGNTYLLIVIFTFGIWAGLISARKQAKRKEVLNELKFDTSRLSSFIQMNY